MSVYVHVSPHKSEDEPYETYESVSDQVPAMALFVVPIVPSDFTILTA